MRVGLAYNVKPADTPDHLPEDAFEEYDSEATVGHIENALSRLGHDVRRLPAGRGFVDAVRGAAPDIVFNIAEGEGGRCREAHVPAVLEMLGVPYVGSDPLTLCATLDKPVAKRLVEHCGFSTPPFRTFRSAEAFDSLPFPFPVIVKPAFEGSSKGVRISSRATTFGEARDMVRFVTETYRQEALVEAFVPGAEVTVGVLGNDPQRVVGMMEIVPKTVPPSEFVYSLEVKRDWENQVSYRVPPDLPAATLAEIERCALGIYRALGCLDFSRIDFRLDASGTPQFIECNPLPGLSPGYGDLPIMAERTGLPYLSLVSEILSHALARLGMASA
ncbi:MAG TPA: ATP-grasp domain-containing protein [Thermodesulfobacteriota bacterium]|nr:ATP-grasp domain-containing protein [Thermodesulfobacteriota bacterium]